MRFLNLHTHVQSGESNVFEVVNQYPDEFDPDVKAFSIGIHPWRIDKDRWQSDMKTVEDKLRDERCLAIGECGLDKRIDVALALQQEIFASQLKLAIANRKPVIIHCVAAYQEVIEIRKTMRVDVPMIIHGFSKNEQVAKSLLDNGFYLSFGKWLLRNPELKTAFLSVPDDRLFLETDTAEEHIEQVYELALRYKNITVERMKQVTSDNFRTVFGREPEHETAS